MKSTPAVNIAAFAAQHKLPLVPWDDLKSHLERALWVAAARLRDSRMYAPKNDPEEMKEYLEGLKEEKVRPARHYISYPPAQQRGRKISTRCSARGSRVGCRTRS